MTWNLTRRRLMAMFGAVAAAPVIALKGTWRLAGGAMTRNISMAGPKQLLLRLGANDDDFITLLASAPKPAKNGLIEIVAENTHDNFVANGKWEILDTDGFKLIYGDDLWGLRDRSVFVGDYVSIDLTSD